MIELLFSCCGFLVLAVVAAVILSWVFGTGTRTRQQREMLELMRQQATAQGLPVPRQGSSFASVVIAIALVGLFGYWYWSSPGTAEQLPSRTEPRENRPHVTPPKRRQRRTPTGETKRPATEVVGQSITLLTPAPIAESAVDEGFIQDESPEYKKAAAKAEAACSSINAEHVTALTSILEANKNAGKRRRRAIRMARNWCREKQIMVDGDYGRCISAVSKKLWMEDVAAATPPKRARSAPIGQAVEAFAKADEVAMQVARKKLIQQLIDEEIFRKVEYRNSIATIWVAPSFYFLDFDVKEKFASVVYAYVAADTKADIVVVKLKDVQSGKTIGDYGQHWLSFGLRME